MGEAKRRAQLRGPLREIQSPEDFAKLRSGELAGPAAICVGREGELDGAAAASNAKAIRDFVFDTSPSMRLFFYLGGFEREQRPPEAIDEVRSYLVLLAGLLGDEYLKRLTEETARLLMRAAVANSRGVPTLVIKGEVPPRWRLCDFQPA